MALNFGGVSSLFSHSNAYADGFGGTIIEKRILSGNAGPSKLTLLHSGSGKITSASEIEFDNVTFSNGTFTKDEEFYVLIDILDLSTGGGPTLKIRGEDEFGTSTNAITGLPQGKRSTIHINGWNSESPTTEADIKGTYTINPAGNPTGNGFGLELTDEYVLSKKWTLSIRGNVHTGGTLYWHMWVYKRNIVEVVA